MAVCAVGGLVAVPDDSPKAGEPAKPEAVAAKPAVDPGKPAVPDQEALQGVWQVDDVLLSAAGRQRLLPLM